MCNIALQKHNSQYLHRFVLLLFNSETLSHGYCQLIGADLATNGTVNFGYFGHYVVFDRLRGPYVVPGAFTRFLSQNYPFLFLHTLCNTNTLVDRTCFEGYKGPC